MPGLSKKIGFMKHNGDRGFTADGIAPVINVSAATSNIANVDIVDTVAFTITSNLPNKPIYWSSTSNVSNYFTDGINSGTLTLDGSGNASLTKTIFINGTDSSNVNFQIEFRTGDENIGDVFYAQNVTINSAAIVYTAIGTDALYPPIETTTANGEKLIEFRGGVNYPLTQYQNYFEVIDGKNLSVWYLAGGGKGSRGGYNTSTSTDIFRYRCGGEGGGTGGGAGGAVKEGNVIVAESSNISIRVGRTGVPTISSGTTLVGEDGSSTEFGNIAVAPGGGKGGSFYVSGIGLARIGSNRFTVPSTGGGGSPGGNANVSATSLNTTTTLGGSASLGNVFAGGNGTSSSYIFGNGSTFTVWEFMHGGGGGGAGGAGGDATSSAPGNAGAGLPSNITGTTTYYGSGLPGRGFSTTTGSCQVGNFNDPGPRYVSNSGVVYIRFKPYQLSLEIS
jgi:hypothetical protein